MMCGSGLDSGFASLIHAVSKRDGFTAIEGDERPTRHLLEAVDLVHLSVIYSSPRTVNQRPKAMENECDQDG